MEGFKKDFYTPSSKKERKSEENLRKFSFTQHQLFSQQSQKPEIQQKYEQQKQNQKKTHVLTSMLEEKPRKQAKSALHQEISEFKPSGQMSMEQFVKVLLNLQEEAKKLRKDNEQLVQQLNLAEGIESRLMSQERELVPFETQHKVRITNSKISFRNRLNWIIDSENRREILNFQERVKRNWNYTIGNRSLKRAKTTIKIIKNQKKMFLLWKLLTFLSEVLEILIKIKKLLDKRTKKEKKEQLRMKIMYCNTDDSIYKIKMKPYQVKGRKTWRSPSSQFRQNWTTQTFILNNRKHELLSS